MLQWIRFMVQRIKIIASQPKQVFMFIFLPLVLLVLLSAFITESVDEGKIPVVFVDEDNSAYSAVVIERVTQTERIAVESVDRESALRIIQAQEAEVAFIIDDHFMQRIQEQDIAGLVTVVESPSSLATGLLREVVASEVLRLVSNVTAAHDVVRHYAERGLITAEEQESLWLEAWEYTDDHWEPVPLLTVNYTEQIQPGQEEGRPEGTNKSATILGLVSVWLMLCTFFANDWIIKEKQSGLWSRILLTAAKSGHYLIGNGLGVFVTLWLSVVVLVAYMAYSAILPVEHVPSVLFLLSLYLFICHALSLVWAVILGTVKQLYIVGLFSTVLTSVFGGSFVQVGELTSRLDMFAAWTPQHWLLTALRDVMTNDSLSIAVGPVLVLASVGVVLFVISYGVVKVYDRA